MLKEFIKHIQETTQPQIVTIVSAISKCHFSPKWNIVFYWMAYRRYTALYTNLLVGLKPVKP